jgi:hypothetical protein
MKVSKQTWLVEASYMNGPYQPFCQSISCKSKFHAEQLAKEKANLERSRGGQNLRFRVALYRRVK